MLVVETGDPAGHQAGPVGRATRRLWRAPLGAHVVGLVVVLAALFPLMSPRSSFTSDEGAYALQVKALQGGSWAYEYQAGRFDPDGQAFPIIKSDGGPAGYYPYAKHPAWPLLLLAATSVAGDTVGLHLLGLLGVVGVAVAAWLLAGELDPRLRRPAFWLAAGGPVVVSGFAIWAHAPSAAVAGVALVAAARIARRGLTPGAAAVVVAALVAGVLLRSEGLLFAGALAVALAAVSLRTAGWARAAATFALLAVPAGLAAKLEDRWVGRIVGGAHQTISVRESGSTSYVGGRVGAAWHELLQGYFSDPAAALPVLAALGLVVVLGLLALRRWGPTSRPLLGAAAAGTLLLLAIRYAGHPHEAVPGLLTAWPLAVLGVLLFRWRGPDVLGRLLGGTVVLYAGAVLATQYPEAGGLEWGGRFLSPILVPLAALAVAGLARALDAVPRPDRTFATALVVAVGVATTAFGLATAGALRSREDSIVAALARHPGQVVVTTRPAYPRLAWRADADLPWMLTDQAGLPALVADLRDRGVDDIVLVVPTDDPLTGLAGFPSLTEVREPALRDDGMKLVVARAE